MIYSTTTNTRATCKTTTHVSTACARWASDVYVQFVTFSDLVQCRKMITPFCTSNFIIASGTVALQKVMLKSYHHSSCPINCGVIGSRLLTINNYCSYYSGANQSELEGPNYPNIIIANYSLFRINCASTLTATLTATLLYFSLCFE